MGAPMGYFGDDNVRDFPELNKCPDCETFFQDLNCPLCGKECSEEFRAGNRKPVKQKKRRRPSSSGRVQFVPWYLSTWFIILMLFLQPIIGLILVWVGYWQKPAKIIVTAVAVLYFFGSFLFGGLFGIYDMFFNREEIPVNTKLSRAEYIEECVDMSAETVYREASKRKGEYVSLTVTVAGRWENLYDYDSDYSLYLECTAEENGKTWTFLVRDYRGDDINLAVGDTITVYGQIGGNVTIRNSTAGEISAPCINMLYVTIEP